MSWSLVCLFGFFVPFENCSLSLETSPLPVKRCNFDLYSVVMATEQWGFYNVPHLLWHGPTLYHLRGPVTLTPVAQRLSVELSLPVQRFRSVPTGDRTPISSLRGERFTTTPPLGCLRVMKKAGTVVAHFLERSLCITKGQMFKSRQRQTYKNSHRSECQGISIVMSTEDESKFAVLYKQMVTTLYEW